MRNIFKLTAIPLFLVWLTSNAFSLSIRIGASANYYSTSDSVFKEIYGKGGFMPGGFLGCDLAKFLEIRAEFNYFQAKGKMTLTKEDIALTLMPIVFCVRFRLVFGKFSPYVGAGIDYIFCREEYPARIGNVSESKLGMHTEAGSHINLTSRLYIDLNLRYVKADVPLLTGDTIRLGGGRAGIGVGYIF